jgi:uncharacterized membrane protein
MKVVDRVNSLVGSRVYSNRPLMEFLFMFLMVYAILDAIILAWFFLSPFAVQSSNRLVFGVAMLAYNFGYLTSNCHQMPEHSLIFGGYEMPFCARDTGIYVGCLVAAVLPFVRVRVPAAVGSWWFAGLVMAPMAVDGVTQSILDWRESTNELRVATGLLFGFGMVYFFAVRIVENSRGFVDLRSEAVKAARIGVLFAVLILVASYHVGGGYVTREVAVRESGLQPSFVTYAPARAMQTVRWDQYLGSYDDAVLSELVAYGSRGHGVWVVYEGEMRRDGKHVFFTPGNGTFKLVPDVQ